jgi:hypothetical protein
MSAHAEAMNGSDCVEAMRVGGRLGALPPAAVARPSE